MASLWLGVLAMVGGLVVIRFVLSALDFLSFHLSRPSQPLKSYMREADAAGQPAYDLITGGSAGIGLGTAHELARYGFGVILVGRQLEKLAGAAAAIRAQPASAAVEMVVLGPQNAA